MSEDNEIDWPFAAVWIVVVLCIFAYSVNAHMQHQALVDKTVTALIERGAYAEAGALLVSR